MKTTDKTNDSFTLTCTFFFKERICNPKQAQTVDEFEHFGTGSGLYMQNGTGVNSVIEIPRDQQKLQENHPWKAEKCFWTQGDNPLHRNASTLF